MRKGLTLLEILTVMIILAVLASMIFGYMNFVETARVRETETRVLLIGQAVEKYRLVKGFLPASLVELSPKTLDEPGWMNGGKFVDIWDRPIQYVLQGNSFRVWSFGSDGASGTLDDIKFKNR